MNQWPGIRLRVTEAWDEDLHHAEQSLHYEGRAVDLTTSDRDRTKYGLLARLAVESGFDWVYYESRAHIHASCKSEAQNPSKSGGCFIGSSKVMTDTGELKEMSQLQIGDLILTSSSDGQLEFSPIILFLDRDPLERRQFFEIETESGNKLTVTPSHLIYAHLLDDKESNVEINSIEQSDSFKTVKNEGQFEAVYASQVREGDYVLVQQKGEMVPTRIAAIETKIHTGVFAPLTASGNLVVDGTLASCYAVVQSQNVAHWAFAPFRWTHTIKSWLSPASERSDSSRISSERTEGIHWYANFLYSVAQILMPGRLMR